MLELLFDDPAPWKLVSIPLTAAVIGWFTNWIAIRMTFHPLRFLGIPPWLGWQGIIPRKAEKMARIFVDSSMRRLGSVPELFEGMEPEAIARHIEQGLAPRLRRAWEFDGRCCDVRACGASCSTAFSSFWRR